MKTTNDNAQSSNHPTQTSCASKMSGIGVVIIVAATVLCGMVSGLSTYSAAQEQTITYSEATSAHPSWVQIPGELIRPDCVHEIPKGAMVEVANDGQITGDVSLNGALVAHYDPCSEDAVVTRPRARTEGLAYPAASGNGWVEASQWDVPLGASDNIDYMAGTWFVPSYPELGGAVIYLFNGIEPSGGAWILQPVLQYGSNGIGGGNYWAIASWLVGSNGYAFYSPLEIVSPGDWIFGTTKMTSMSGDTTYWKVEAKDTTSGKYSWITAHVSGQHWNWAYAGVLEAYNVSSCSQFPSDYHDIFSNSVVDHGFPSYKGLTTGWYGARYLFSPICGFKVDAGSTSTLFF